MKKTLSIMLSALLLALLAACGSTQDTTTPQEPEDPSQTSSSQSAAEATQPERDAETTLTYYLEGIETHTEATLYNGNGYSIYFPAMEWMLESQEMDGHPTQVLQSDWNEDVMLRIVELEEMDLTQAQDWIREAMPGYDLVEDAQGGLGGSNAKKQLLDVRFCPADDTIYALMLQYPLEAAEGFGTRLNVFADTFVTEN